MMLESAAAMGTIKSERPDDAEIQEMANKIRENHKVKMATQPANSGKTPTSGAPELKPLVAEVKPVVAAGSTSGAVCSSPSTTDSRPIDAESQRGRFGWTVIGTVPIPYIFRNGTEKYCAVKMVESKVLNKYLSFLNADIYNYTNVRSYFITDAETRIINEINMKHCDGLFGRDHYTCKDLVVRLSDALEFHQFLEICFNKISGIACGATNASRCGFIRINSESVVPFTTSNKIKYVPLFYFEGETESLKLKAITLEGWDLAYLKFCCKVQGIRNELFANETCLVISVDDIKNYFPAGTQFDDYWPAKMQDCQLITKNPIANAMWTKQPTCGPTLNKNAQAPRMYVSNATPTWNGMAPQQSGQQPRMPHVNSQRQWATNSQTAPPTTSYPYQMQQQQHQKAMPPPLVRAADGHSRMPMPNMTMTQNRNYTIIPTTSKSVPLRTPSSQYRFNGYTNPDAMDLTAQQRAQYARNKDIRSVSAATPAATIQNSNASQYYMDNHYVDGVLVPCLVAKYRREEPLITIQDFTSKLFPNLQTMDVQKILSDVLKVDFQTPSRAQVEALRLSGRCRSDLEQIPLLLKLVDANGFMPQLKYIVNNKQPSALHQPTEIPSKRMRIS